MLVVLFVCTVGAVFGQDPPAPPREFVSEEFGFKAVYPAAPEYSVENDRHHRFTATAGGQMFSVSVMGLTGEWQKAFETQPARASELNQGAYIKGAEGKLLGAAKEVKIGDLPAREFAHTVGKDWRATTRMVFSGGKLYFISVVTLVDLNPYRQLKADEFVRSFRIIPKTSTK